MSKMRVKNPKKSRWAAKYPLLRKYLPLVHEDLAAIYSRDLHKWLADRAHHRGHDRLGDHRYRSNYIATRCGLRCWAITCATIGRWCRACMLGFVVTG